MRKPGEILDRYQNNERSVGPFTEYTLDSIRALLDRLGNPQKKLKFIHVAGTNGKGSTCYMIASIITGHGYRTGLFTSPHLDDVRERIAIDNVLIPEDIFIDILEIVDDAARLCGGTITYFDILTATAIVYFFREKVSFVILETGLGGRLDSTNAIDPLVSVITPIDFDHTDMLGDTLGKISSEKAGIIKNGIPVVTSNYELEVLDILRSQSAIRNSPIKIINEDFHVRHVRTESRGIAFSYIDDRNEIADIEIPHPGRFQADNAACAIASVISAGVSIDHSVIRKSLSKLVIPGRMETLLDSPHTIFDPAHNHQSVSALLTMLKERYESDRVAVFVSFMKDKNPSSLLSFIRNNITGDIVYVSLDGPRAYQPSAADARMTVVHELDIEKISQLMLSNDCSLNIFTGSFRMHSIARDAVRLLIDRKI